LFILKNAKKLIRVTERKTFESLKNTILHKLLATRKVLKTFPKSFDEKLADIFLNFQSRTLFEDERFSFFVI
jgi:hypothetical protein